MHALVVGGSLVGQSAALALVRQDWQVTVVEQSSGSPPSGTGIGIDRHLLSAVTGMNPRDLPVLDQSFEQTTWNLVRAALATEVRRQSNIRILTGQQVLGVETDQAHGDGVVRTDAGEVRPDLVVGADGVGSVVRRYVAPDQPHAVYGGYLLWRGLVDEHRTPNGFAERDVRFAEHCARKARLVTFGVPGGDGRIEVGSRRASFSWFDAGRSELLRAQGCIDGDRIRGSLAGSRIPDALVLELREFARMFWPPPWGDALDRCLRDREFVGTPIAEYLPIRLVRGVAALVGDAAHVVSPVTGAGFHNGLLDIEALAAAVGGASKGRLSEGLAQYQARRLKPARRLVTGSKRWSRDYVLANQRCPDDRLAF